jgi:hypothetical protein
MSTTVILTSLLPFALVAGAICAVPVSLLLLGIYRNAVTRGMRASASTASAGPRAARSRAPLPPAAPLHIVRIDPETAIAPCDALPEDRRAVRGKWDAAAIYVAAGAAYAAVMTAGTLLATRQAFLWSRVLLLSWTFLWPAVLNVVVVAAYDGRRRRRVLGAYALGLIAIGIFVAARNSVTVAATVPVYWLLTNGAETVLVLLSFTRRIRAVGPLVLAFMIALAIGSQTLLVAAGESIGLLRLLASVGMRLGLGATAVFAFMILAGMVAFGGIGWPLLRIVGRRYERKAFSDQAIVVDATWLVFAIGQSIGLAFEGPPWILTGAVAFAAYKLVATWLFLRRRADQRPDAPRTLLLLRVFALGARSERLFDRLRRHWQYAGPITMIAGPDLVTATVEPNEFLAFVSGRLSRQFVSDAQDLESRFAAVDRQPDPDLRYRITEFFCRNDTWQMTMARLAGSADAVLMDLRGFSAANKGCIYELGHLVDSVDLAHVVFLVDRTTDLTFLDATLRELWEGLRSDSPNHRSPSCSARLFTTASQSEDEIRCLLRLLVTPSAAAQSTA